jgi:hypothetical protein
VRLLVPSFRESYDELAYLDVFPQSFRAWDEGAGSVDKMIEDLTTAIDDYQ